MRNQLKKALRLARKSNNPIIFFDALTPEDSFAIVDLDRYEEMISPEMLDKTEVVYKPGLTDGDLADKINREISDWKNDENSQFLAEESKPRKNWNIPPQVKGKAESSSN